MHFSLIFVHNYNSQYQYISYDSTNENSQAGDVEIVEAGHPKVDMGLPVFNYSIAYDTDNRERLYYEKHEGEVK